MELWPSGCPGLEIPKAAGIDPPAGAAPPPTAAVLPVLWEVSGGLQMAQRPDQRVVGVVRWPHRWVVWISGCPELTPKTQTVSNINK